MKFPEFLRIAVIPKPHIIILNKTDGDNYEIVGGPDGELIKIFAQALNFSYKLIPATDGAKGNFINGTWTGGIGLVHRNKADIGISKFGISLFRSQCVDFSYPYRFQDLTFVTKKPGFVAKDDAYAYPFNVDLWAALIVVFSAMVIIFSFVERTNLLDSMQQLFSILVRQFVNLKKNKLKNKIIQLTWIWSAWFLTSAYVAVLLSHITIPSMEKGVETIDELATEISAGMYKAMTIKGTMFLEMIEESKRKSAQIVSEHIIKHNHLTDPNRSLLLDMLHKEKMAFISVSDNLRFFAQNDLFMSKDSFRFHMSAIAMSKTFCCKKKVNDFIHKIVASGIYSKLVNDPVFKACLKSKHLEDTDSSEDNINSLSLADVQGAFVLIILGYSLALIVIFIEIIYAKNSCRKK